jgi:hypothetical protein
MTFIYFYFGLISTNLNFLFPYLTPQSLYEVIRFVKSTLLLKTVTFTSNL